MWLADGWKDYQVIDCSKGEKLERWGEYLLVRPDPQVIWDTPRKEKGWHKMNAHYHRSKKGGGEWEFFNLPEEWSIHYRELTFRLKPFSFKHTGQFLESDNKIHIRADGTSAGFQLLGSAGANEYYGSIRMLLLDQTGRCNHRG